MDTKDYSRLLGYLQKILEYFIYVNFVILVIDWIVFRHMGYRHLDSIYSTFIGTLPLLMTKCVEFCGKISRMLTSIVLSLLTTVIVFVTYIWFRIYSFFVISPHVIYVLYIYTYFLSVFMLWLPGFYRYLLNYDEKLWFNPRKRLENDISLS